MLSRTTLTYSNAPLSLNWKDGNLIDWVDGGSVYSLDGTFKASGRGYAYRFDAAIQSDNGAYAVIYEKLGTKALLLKNGDIVRELNRSYYCANEYEYPIAFVNIRGNYAIIHCPEEYNQIEVEDIETGRRITATRNRKPMDCFHSRFRVNDANTMLINAGWVWHPNGIAEVYAIEKALKDSSVFDTLSYDLPINVEVTSAEFLDNDLILLASPSEEPFDYEEVNNKTLLNAKELGLFSIQKDEFIKKVKVDFKMGTQVPLDMNYAIDLYEYPKLIDINTGKIVQQFEDIYSGKQNLAILQNEDKVPPIAIDKVNQRVAIANGKTIELLEFN